MVLRERLCAEQRWWLGETQQRAHRSHPRTPAADSGAHTQEASDTAGANAMRTRTHTRRLRRSSCDSGGSRRVSRRRLVCVGAPAPPAASRIPGRCPPLRAHQSSPSRAKPVGALVNKCQLFSLLFSTSPPMHLGFSSSDLQRRPLKQHAAAPLPSGGVAAGARWCGLVAGALSAAPLSTPRSPLHPPSQDRLAADGLYPWRRDDEVLHGPYPRAVDRAACGHGGVGVL